MRMKLSEFLGELRSTLIGMGMLTQEMERPDVFYTRRGDAFGGMWYQRAHERIEFSFFLLHRLKTFNVGRTTGPILMCGGVCVCARSALE